MSELKFRVWHRGKMIVRSLNDLVLESPPHYMFADRQVMRFTGIKDSNGTEIYEGDILLFRWPSGKGQNTYIAKIGYSLHALDDYGDAFAYSGVYFLEQEGRKPVSGYGHPSIEQLEIIGNIYENPELSKKED